MAEANEGATRPPGRPRSEASRRAILDATQALLEQMTVRELSIEGIAREAGVGKTTIYRWWPNKSAVVIDAFFDQIAPRMAAPQADNAAEAIDRQTTRLANILRGPLGRIVAEVIAEGQSDPEVLEHFREAFLDHARRAAGEAIATGIKSGLFAKNLNLDAAVDLIYGPLYFRLLAGHKPVNRAFAKAVADMAVQALKRRRSA
jgi:AcrR family transcriptional regulator